MNRPVLRTGLCDLLGIEYPIFLAGMGGFGSCTPPELVAAVSEAGGMGMIGGTALPPEVLRGMIRETRKLTDKPFGVDLLLPASDSAEAASLRSAIREQIRARYPVHWRFAEEWHEQFGLTPVGLATEEVNTASGARRLFELLLEEKVDVFAAALGDPGPLVPRAHAQGMKVMGLAGGVRHALKHQAVGVDLVVATGAEAGGHTGPVGTMPLVPQVVNAVRPLPVVAAGGIGSGSQVAAALAMGAAGVWVGTAFLVSEECRAEEGFKDLILAARSEDFDVSLLYTGKRHRGLRNVATEKWKRSGLEPLPHPFQKVLFDDFQAAALAAGHVELQQNPSGQIGGMLNQRKPAAQIMRELVEGAIESIRALDACIAARSAGT